MLPVILFQIGDLPVCHLHHVASIDLQNLMLSGLSGSANVTNNW